MEKAVSLFKDGERMTPIMQKIEDLRSAITRYNRVTAKRAKPKIGFAYGIILFADAASLYENIPQSQWHLFRHSRHTCFIDAHKEYCQVLTCWLQEND
ncbi:MAG: hypothetical protein IKO86_07155 [Prevotella sp.]|jgi:hypothetical protein|nr:hypothetical protein [Prevotella sp.]